MVAGCIVPSLSEWICCGEVCVNEVLDCEMVRIPVRAYHMLEYALAERVLRMYMSFGAVPAELPTNRLLTIWL